MHNMIKKILIKKKEDIKKKRLVRDQIFSRNRTSPSILRKNLSLTAQTRKSFFQVINEKSFAIIAELKFASPSLGILADPSELLKRAKEYEKRGASAISIITEPNFFHGDIKFIPRVKKAVRLPILQKDFVIDGSQIYTAKKIGSDALLLIARIVPKKQLQKFVDLCFEEGIEPVVEIHTVADLKKATDTNTRIIAVNARDLDTFRVDVEKACALLKKIPKTFTRLGFSGIVSNRELSLYKHAGAQAVLIGKALMLKNQDLFDFKRRESRLH